MPKPSQSPAPSTPTTDTMPWMPGLFAGLLGAFLGLLLLKFGNPPIMEKMVTTPEDAYAFVFAFPWPIRWAYCLLGVVALVGLFTARWRCDAPKWLLLLPLVWLGWQYVAAARSIDPAISSATNWHLASAVLCFYLGYFSLSRARSIGLTCFGLLLGFSIVLAEGWQQHFGGLEETRKYFYLYVYPKMQDIAPEYLKKLTSSRIFSTLFYPNTLAGALLLLLPAMAAFLWQLKDRFTPAARGFLVAVLGVGAVACLFWSGSKGGWLLMLLLGLVTLLHLDFSRKLKWILVSALIVLGLAGFFWKYASFFKKGATSVGARFDYWEAAVRVTTANPLFGTGPGTFGTSYSKIRRPESEPARLTHNDYLQQASDSGLIGCATYTVFIAGCLVWSYPGFPRRVTAGSHPASLSREGDAAEASLIRYAIWLGVLGWALQGLMDFPLYIPALAWTALALLGWLMAQPRTAEAT